MAFLKSVLTVILALSIGSLSTPVFSQERDSHNGLNFCEQLLRSDANQSLRNQFVQRYASRIYASESQNLQWMAELSAPDSSLSLYVTMENAQLKNLNDKIILDKDLVTALTNFHKELFLEKIKSHFKEDSYSFYSDFKAVLLKINAPPSEQLTSEIESIMRQTNHDFFNNPRLKQIVRESDLLQANWFTLGMGQTEGEASLAARRARADSSLMVKFDDPDFQEKMFLKLIQFKNLHRQLTQTTDGAEIMASLDTFIQCRKAQSAQQLKSALREEFPSLLIGSEFSNNLLDYCRLADEFSPSLLTPKREMLTIEEAPYGVIAMDFIGLGGENLKATAEALLRANDVSEAMEQSRLGEQTVTRSFHLRRDKVRAVLEDYFKGQVNVRFSGDDGVVIPQREFDFRDQIQLLTKLSELLPYSFFRMSTIGANSAKAGLSLQLVSQSESIEKALKPLLRKVLGAPVARRTSVNVFNTEQDGVNKVFLILHLPSRPGRSEVKILYSLFDKALRQVERDFRTMGKEIILEAGDIFSTHPR